MCSSDLTIDGDVVAVSDLARLRVGDPAADLAAVSSMLTPEDFERFFRSYRAHRDPDDPGLRRRVGFHAEITVLEWLLAAVAAQDDAAIDDAADLLQALAEVTGDAEDTGDADVTDRDESGEPADPDESQESAAESAAPGSDDAEAARTTPSTRTAADPDPDAFRPSARIEAGVDEDGISTERLDTSELHALDPREGDEPDRG